MGTCPMCGGSNGDAVCDECASDMEAGMKEGILIRVGNYKSQLAACQAEVERLRAENEQIPVLTQAVAEALHNFGKARAEIERLRVELNSVASVVVRCLQRSPVGLFDCASGAADMAAEIERLRATIERIHHFAVGDCKMGDATRLKCIAAECKAESASAAGGTT